MREIDRGDLEKNLKLEMSEGVEVVETFENIENTGSMKSQGSTEDTETNVNLKVTIGTVTKGTTETVGIVVTSASVSTSTVSTRSALLLLRNTEATLHTLKVTVDIVLT
jgi:hypothetical protein